MKPDIHSWRASWGMGGFLLGAALPVLFQPVWWAIAALAGILVWRLRSDLVCAALVGVLWTLGAVHGNVSQLLSEPRALDQMPLQIERCWSSDWSSRCLVRQQGGGRYYLNWRTEGTPEPGQTGMATGSLRPWRATVSPGQTSFALWMLRHRIQAQGQIDDFEQTEPRALNRWLLNLRDRVRQRPVSGQARGFYEALVLGDRAAMDAQVRGQVARTQTQHLLALSGLHIGSLALWAYWIAGWVWRLHPVGVRQDWQKLAALVIAGGLLWLALPAVSLWRAFLMALLPGLAWLYRRRLAAHHLLLIIGCLMVIGDPLLWLDLGAWFSWWATLVLIMLARHIGHWPGWRQLVGIQLSLSLLLVPVHALWSLPLFPAGMMLNLLLIPLVSFVALPLAFLAALGVPLAATGFGLAADLWRLLLVLFDQPWAWLPVLDPLQSLLLAAGCALGLLVRARWIYWLLLIALAGSTLWHQSRGPALALGEFELWVLDAGQGQAAIVETAAGRVVMDTGTGPPAALNLSQTLLRWFWWRPRGDWTTLVLSRPGRFTEGGLGSLATMGFAPQQAFSARPPRFWPADWSEPRFCDLNVQWQQGGVQFRFLRPQPGYQPESTTEGACMLEVRSPHGAVVISGGAGATTEHGLLLRQQPAPVDVLVSSRGGTAAANTRAWLEALRPRRVVHSAQRNPAGEVQARIAAVEAEAHCTCGRHSWWYRFTESGLMEQSYGLRLLPWLRIPAHQHT
ncbi:ComEC/Rec2 family competence protein [Natronospirillum operosum]|uniref:ComEC/Rec2 family competence protein n=1 Tax=Natronospirillum operosum TaxID=2759953 RepID=A0A4Z0WEW8_9GAMM|nr:ComEC/Rec2 family competence protein [Natronospirillum operosum]TGG95580.1 ComEC/Rec2 family competence protein [Natronospirillum operosum]